MRRASTSALLALLALILSACAWGQPATPPPTSTTTVTPPPATSTVTPTETATPTVTSTAPVPTTTTTAPPTTATPTAQPPAPGAPDVSGCAQPAGMNGLKDQDPSDSQNPWKREKGKKTLIKVDYSAVYDPSLPAAKAGNKEWYDYGVHAIEFWNQSPCLNLVMAPGTCPKGGGNLCVKVDVVSKGDDGNFDEVTKGGFNTGGHITLLASLKGKKIDLGAPIDRRPCSERLNVSIHELGHAVGLLHVKTPKVIMDPETYPDVCGVTRLDDKAKGGPRLGGPDRTALDNIAFGATKLQKYGN